MSYTSVPKISLPAHTTSNALEVLFVPVLGNAFFRDLERSRFGKKAIAAVSPACESMLNKWDKYMHAAATELWTATSFYTGNTRGSLKQEGTEYYDSDVVFDEDAWFAPKELPSLKEKVVEATWKTKKGTKHKTYRYPAGKMVKITGEDYAPRIPLPPHMGGEVDELIDAYENAKETEFRKAGFHA